MKTTSATLHRLAFFLLPIVTVMFSAPLAASAAGMSDTDLPGGDYRSFDLVSPVPSFCQRACSRDSRCQAWTFSWPGKRGKRAKCFLKNKVVAKKSDTCCISGIRGKPTSQPEPKPKPKPEPQPKPQPKPEPQQKPEPKPQPRPDAEKQAFCLQYADRAMAAKAENRRLQCGYRDGRWNASRRGYYNWCMNNPRSAAAANTRARQRLLARCRAGERRDAERLRDMESCNEYARVAVMQARQAFRLRCGYHGPRWTFSMRRHFRWCRTAPLSARRAEVAARRAALNRCRRSIGQGPVRVIEELFSRLPWPATRPPEGRLIYKWIKVRGPGIRWSTRWRPTRTGKCLLVRGCECGGESTCGVYPAGTTALYWPNGCRAAPWVIQCRVRRARR